jgi:hypothetical protein
LTSETVRSRICNAKPAAAEARTSPALHPNSRRNARPKLDGSSKQKSAATSEIGRRSSGLHYMRCVFRSNATGQTYHYTGTITRLGLDVGVTGGGRLFWGVFAPTSRGGPGTLRGNYVGASGNASLGLGPGRQRTGGRIKSHYLVAMRTDHHRLHRLSRLRCSRRVTPADRGKTGDSNDGARQDICQDVAATHCSHSVCSCTLRSWDRISATPNRCEFTPTW